MKRWTGAPTMPISTLTMEKTTLMRRTTLWRRVAFSERVPLKRIGVGHEGKTWQVYDTGPRDATGSPLVCLPPIAGTADIFFRQCLALSVRGYRVLSVEAPP